MFRTTTSSLLLIGLFLFGPMVALGKPVAIGQRKEIHVPLERVFKHQKHMQAFKKMKISCQDCHRFSIKSKKTGGLPKSVNGKFLHPSKGVCHQCHLGQLALPRPNQCVICHTDVVVLRPKDHDQAWMKRHGRFSQLDSDSCKKCHTKSGCSECHLKRDPLKNRVHSGNFRLTHSIKARANQGCVTCHRSQKFCTDCHDGRKK